VGYDEVFRERVGVVHYHDDGDDARGHGHDYGRRDGGGDVLHLQLYIRNLCTYLNPYL